VKLHALGGEMVRQALIEPFLSEAIIAGVLTGPFTVVLLAALAPPHHASFRHMHP